MIICFTEKPGKPVASPGTHRNEFPTRYSLVGCSPAVGYQTGRLDNKERNNRLL